MEGGHASIQQYISDCQRQAEELVNEDGEATPVDLPNDFAFGFDAFFDESDVPESVEEIAYLNNQRQVLEFILSKLFASAPSSIESIARQAFPKSGWRKIRFFHLYDYDGYGCS